MYKYLDFFRVCAFLFILSLLINSCGSSRINKDTSSHKQFINNSKLNNESVLSLDTLYYKGDPYAVMKESGFSLSPFYTFYTLSGTKSIDVMPYSGGDGKTVTHHEYKFHGTSENMSGYLSFEFSTMNVCDNIINNNLLNTNELRPIDVGNFCKKNPRPPKFNPARLKVEREMSLPIKINQGYGQVYQGEKQIGKFTQHKDKSNDYPVENAIFKLTFMNNTQCAVITFPYDKFDRNKHKYLEVMTEYDGKTHRLTIDDDKTTFDVDAFKQAVEYLVLKGYL
jgi:hypothetical protein